MNDKWKIFIENFYEKSFTKFNKLIRNSFLLLLRNWIIVSYVVVDEWQKMNDDVS